MRQGRSLTELAGEIERRRESKHDLLARTDAITMSVEERAKDGLDGEFERLLKLNVASEKFGINSVAHDQLGTYTEIPAKYYDRMATEAPELLARNVNHWLAKEGTKSKRMVRTLDGNVRAFLSDKYRRIENEDLAEAILPYLLDNETQLCIMSCEVTDKKLYLKVVHEKVKRELAKTGNYLGDGKSKVIGVVAPAITISNSEVGHGAVSIQVGIFDRFCSNLATFGERSMRKYHAGTRQDLLGDDLSAVLSQDTQRLNDAALMATVKDVVKAAFDETRFNALVDQIEGTSREEIHPEADPVKVVELASRKLGITEGESKGVLQALIKGGELNRFGLYNAVTAFSQTVSNYDRATELERIGAGVIELPQAEWNSIALAK